MFQIACLDSYTFQIPLDFSSIQRHSNVLQAAMLHGPESHWVHAYKFCFHFQNEESCFLAYFSLCLDFSTL